MPRALPSRDVPSRHLVPSLSVLAAAAVWLAACTTTDIAGGGAAPTVVIPPGPPVVVDIALLPGKWGLASYREEKDRARTEAEAKRACGNPYVIGSGSQGGVLMHLPDQSQPTEVFIKTTPDGRSLIGPRGPVGMPQDRVVMYFQGGVLITEWLDPSARERYGTMMLVRCA
ncbi:MAG TPA: hypothetical protein VFK86_00315 [Bauldia sp.]|nr:hypothetical protein [Bauldia sp.]